MKKAILVALLAVCAAYVTYAQGWGAAPLRRTLIAPCVPAVSSVTPKRGPNTGGVTVTLNGTCFTGVTRVTFGGRPATGFQVFSDTAVTAVTPAFLLSIPGAVRSVPVFVCKPSACSRRTLATDFTFYTMNAAAPRSPIASARPIRTPRTHPAVGKAPSPQTMARIRAMQLARIKAMQRQGAQRVHAAFLTRKANLQAQWLGDRIARGQKLLAADRSAPAALRSILNRNVSSLVALRQTVVSSHQPIMGSLSARVSGVLVRGRIVTLHNNRPRVCPPRCRKPATPPPPPPTISSVSPIQGQPGDQIILIGSGFGSSSSTSVPVGTVTFLLSPSAAGPVGTGSVQQATAVYWSDAVIGVLVPNVSGISAYSGSLYVQAAGGQSNVVAFQFQPVLDVQQVPIGTDNVQLGDDCRSNGQSWCFPYVAGDTYTYSATHWGDWVEGHRGDDWFFKGTTLRNGWTLDSVNFVNNFYTGDCPVDSSNGASIVSSGQGTNTPYVDVHWWDSPDFGFACYYLGLTVIGPFGTSW